MTNAQKITIRISEVRERLNEIAGLEGDAFTDEIRGESETLQTEYKDLETRYRSAVIAEGEEEAKQAGKFGQGDGESAEIRGLLDRVSLSDYLGPATVGGGIAGAATELNAALKVPIAGKAGGVLIPWHVLEVEGGVSETRHEGAQETRAFTDTGQYAGGVAQRPILQRLFGLDIMDALGVRIDSVPDDGRTEWPLITGGVAPNMKTEGTAADAAVQAEFDTETLKAKRLTGRYEYSHEMAAQVPDLEQALRRDLADAVRSKMNYLILNGDEATNSQEPDGFLTTMDLTVPTDPTSASTYADYAGSHALGVDGIHAGMETQVSSVIGTETYQHAAGVYQAGSGESGSEALRRRSMACMASSFIPAPASEIQNGNIFHSAGPNGGAMRGDSVAAIWPTLEIIRDIYTQASQGVVLTWVTLWDLKSAFRAAAYKRIAFRHA